jgi:hypothetical protein
VRSSGARVPLPLLDAAATVPPLTAAMALLVTFVRGAFRRPPRQSGVPPAWRPATAGLSAAVCATSYLDVSGADAAFGRVGDPGWGGDGGFGAGDAFGGG